MYINQKYSDTYNNYIKKEIFKNFQYIILIYQ